eukprot:6188846-Pleurochrysis_carterae.AAC.6
MLHARSQSTWLVAMIYYIIDWLQLVLGQSRDIPKSFGQCCVLLLALLPFFDHVKCLYKAYEGGGAYHPQLPTESINRRKRKIARV